MTIDKSCCSNFFLRSQLGQFCLQPAQFSKIRLFGALLKSKNRESNVDDELNPPNLTL